MLWSVVQVVDVVALQLLLDESAAPSQTIDQCLLVQGPEASRDAGSRASLWTSTGERFCACRHRSIREECEGHENAPAQLESVYGCVLSIAALVGCSARRCVVVAVRQ